ncbi:Tar (HIV-1) RNA binding protein 1, partial [Kappamyces sp. JEL0680]
LVAAVNGIQFTAENEKELAMLCAELEKRPRDRRSVAASLHIEEHLLSFLLEKNNDAASDRYPFMVMLWRLYDDSVAFLLQLSERLLHTKTWETADSVNVAGHAEDGAEGTWSLDRILDMILIVLRNPIGLDAAAWEHLTRATMHVFLSARDRQHRIGSLFLPLVVANHQFEATRNATCRQLWALLSSLDAADANVPMYLCALFSAFMGLVQMDGTHRYQASLMAVDLRAEPQVLAILRCGLLSHNSTTIKYSLFLLRKLIWFEDNFHCPGAETLPPLAQSLHFEEFFTLYDSLLQDQHHIVEPHLAKFSLIAKTLDRFWYELLVRRGLINNVLKVRKTIIRYFITLADPVQQHIFQTQPDIFLAIVAAADKQWFYHVVGQGTFSSPFGEELVVFLSSLDMSLDSSFYILEKAIDIVAALTSRIPMIYVLQGLASLSPHQTHRLANKHVDALAYILNCPQKISMFKGRETISIISSYVIRILVTQGRAADFDFSVLAHCLGATLFPESMDSVDQRNVMQIRSWMQFDGSWAAALESLLRSFLASGVSQSLFQKEDEAANAIGVMFFLGHHPAVGDRIWRLIGFRHARDIDLAASFLSKGISCPEAVQTTMVAAVLAQLSQASLLDQVVQLVLVLSKLSLTDSQVASLMPLAARFADSWETFVSIGVLSVVSRYPAADASIAFTSDNLSRWLQVSLQTLFIQERCTSTPARINDCFFAFKSTLARHLVQRLPHLFPTICDYAVDQADSPSILSACALFDLLQTCLEAYAGPIDAANFRMLLKAGVAIVLECWNAPRFWLTLVESFCRFAFHKALLLQDDLVDDILATWKQVLGWAEGRVAVANAASNALYAFFSGCRPRHLLSHAPILLDMVEFGYWRQEPDHKLDALFALKGVQLDQEHEEEYRNTVAWNFYCADYVVRVQGNSILTHLDRTDPGNQTLALQLIGMILKRLASKELRGKVFPDSHLHRITLRLWSSFHLLLDFVDDSQCVAVFGSIWDCLVFEKLSDTMAIIEWLLMRMLLQHPRLLPEFYGLVKEAGDKAHIMTSILVVSYHIGRKLANPQDRALCYVHSIQAALAWMSNKNFSTRVLGQLVLCSFWTTIEAERHPLAKELGYVKGIVQQLLVAKDTAKAFNKCQEYFLYSDRFDPVECFNLEFLFRGFWIVLGIGVDERISSSAFLKVDPAAAAIPTGYDERFQWRSIAQESRTADQPALPEGQEAPLQRKIVPWEQIMNADIELSNYRVESKPRNTIQIVASFVSKPANLGGLCRTCETLNAGLLVVDSLLVQKDPLFLTTSVTADRWMPMKEVKVAQLEEYLLEQKSLGWSLIGIEQATKSVSLERFSFPKKSLLLLGKEKEGIPTELLPLMDHIIEIPQFGFIKSLNVHVSGSLVLWEYVKQQIQQK